uniref:FLYWCH-type domain-containing protein n=1 Tax=Meloidogyne floridensis TaxID=298350 RepID=A0A915NHT3_9BILA
MIYTILRNDSSSITSPPLLSPQNTPDIQPTSSKTSSNCPPTHSTNFLFLLNLARIQQIFQQQNENVFLINQAIIKEKNAIANAQKQFGKKNSFNNSININDCINRKDFYTRCGITWKYLTSTHSSDEFDNLRRQHQVSKNRHVGYGTRYACTRNAKVRDNCPYLLLNIPGKNGIQHVYSRNSHTHPIRHIIFK